MTDTELKIRTTLFRGSFAAFSIRAIGAGLALLTQIVLARFLGVAEYGLYIYAITWVILLAQLACVGFDSSLVRYLSTYRTRAQWSLFRGILRVSFLTAGFVSMTIAGLVALLLIITNPALVAGQKQVLLLSLLLLPVFALTTIRQAVLRSLKQAALAQLPEYIVRPLILMGLVTGYYFVTRSLLTAENAIFIHLVAATVTLLIGAALINHALPDELNHASPRYKTGTWLRASAPNLFLSGVILLMSKIDIIMIGSIQSPTSSGIYAASSQIAELVVFAMIAVETIAAPLIAELYSTGKQEQLQRIVTLSTRLASLFSIIAALLLVVFGDTVLGIYGDQFVQGYNALLILIAGQIINAFSGSSGLVLVMTGHQKSAARIAGVSALANILLNLALIPRYGITGAAIATSASIALWNLWMLYDVKRRLGINPGIFCSIK